MAAKLKKAILVIFITCLIWVWADLSLDEELDNQIVTITTSKANPRLWVTLERKPEIQVRADLKGPVAKVHELSKKIETGKEKLEVVFDAEQQNMATAGEYNLQDLRRFLAESKKMQEYGLTVKAVRPDKLQSIQVVELIEKPLPVKCVDETDSEIAGARMSPDVVTMLAPEFTTEAIVKVATLAEKKQARGEAVEKQPYIQLPSGEIRYADATIKIELPATPEEMKQFTINGTLGFIFSANLEGGYRVEFVKPPEVGNITIVATDEARAAYEEKQFEVLLEIDDDDVGKEEVTRALIYNFPAKYVREDKIRLKGEPVEVKFRLVPIDGNEPPQP